MGLSRQEMIVKGFFIGVESAIGLNDYPTVEIETSYQSIRNYNAIIIIIVKSYVD